MLFTGDDGIVTGDAPMMSRRARPWDGSAGMGWRAEQPPHIAAGLLFLLLVYLPGKDTYYRTRQTYLDLSEN